MRLKDQRIVILGGTSGIGLATAKAAADEGANVIVASSSAKRVDGALEELPANATGQVMDVLDEDAVRTLFSELGDFDHLVYTAGDSMSFGLVADTPAKAASEALDVRVWGAFTATRHAARQIRPGGSIVLTSGTAGQRPQPGLSVAALACSAMEGLTRGLAVELAPIRVNIVRPGVVRTGLYNAMDATQRNAYFETTGASLPAGRVGDGADAAAGYVYLMANGYSTGSVITIDGGAILV